MKIDKKNYEAVLLDYLEGRLSETERRDTEAFLGKHPDIAAEFALLCKEWGENGDSLRLTDSELPVFPDKDRLYRIARTEESAEKTEPETYPIPTVLLRRKAFLRYLPQAAMLAACLLIVLLFVFLSEKGNIAEPVTYAESEHPADRTEPAAPYEAVRTGSDETPATDKARTADEAIATNPKPANRPDVFPAVPPQKESAKAKVQDTRSRQGFLPLPTVPDIPSANPVPQKAGSTLSDSLPTLKSGNLHRLLNPMARPKSYYAQLPLQTELLPRTDRLAAQPETGSAENMSDRPLQPRKESRAKTFFAALFKIYTEPIKEKIDESAETLRTTFRWKDYTADTVYQAFWEVESDF